MQACAREAAAAPTPQTKLRMRPRTTKIFDRSASRSQSFLLSVTHTTLYTHTPCLQRCHVCERPPHSRRACRTGRGRRLRHRWGTRSSSASVARDHADGSTRRRGARRRCPSARPGRRPSAEACRRTPDETAEPAARAGGAWRSRASTAQWWSTSMAGATYRLTGSVVAALLTKRWLVSLRPFPTSPTPNGMPTECSSVRMGGWDREGVGATEGITEVIQIGYQSKAVQYCACMRLAAWWGDSIRRDSLGAGGWGGPSKCAVRPSGSGIIRCDAPAPRTITGCSVTSCWAWCPFWRFHSRRAQRPASCARELSLREEVDDDLL